MLKIRKVSANRIDIDLHGKLDADGMRSALDQLIADAADVTQGRMLYRITAFALPTLGAIGVELARLPKLLGLLGKFEKCAVLTDSNWLRKAASVEGAVFRGIEIRSFELADADAAEDWLAARA